MNRIIFSSISLFKLFSLHNIFAFFIWAPYILVVDSSEGSSFIIQTSLPESIQSLLYIMGPKCLFDRVKGCPLHPTSTSLQSLSDSLNSATILAFLSKPPIFLFKPTSLLNKDQVCFFWLALGWPYMPVHLQFRPFAFCILGSIWCMMVIVWCYLHCNLWTPQHS